MTPLVRMEARVRPVAQGATEILALYDEFFAAEDVLSVPVSDEVCERATAIRARYGLRAVDALHLAAAVEAGCEVFLTNDARLQAFPDLRVETLS